MTRKRTVKRKALKPHDHSWRDTGVVLLGCFIYECTYPTCTARKYESTTGR